MARFLRSFLTIVVLTFVSSINAATYYVDKNHSSSSDNNAGTEASPWKTIQKAANTMSAGDTVYVKAGVYTELYSGTPSTDVTAIKPQNSGTASNPIVYSAFPGDSVIIDQQRQGSGFFIENKNYIHIIGFEIRNTWGSGVSTLTSAVGIVVDSNYIHDIDGVGGSNVGGVRLDDARQSTVRNNVIHKVTVGGEDNGNAAGIHGYRMEDILVENNLIYDCFNGIFHKLSTGNTGLLVKNNIIHSVTEGIHYDIQGGGSPAHFNQRVTQNVFYDVDSLLFMNAAGANGVNDGFHVWNNTFDGFNNGVAFLNSRNVNIYNNIFYGSSSSLFKTIIAQGDAPNTVIDYNNYFNAEEYVVDLYKSSEASYNSLAGWRSGENFDTNGNAVDPKFIARASRNYKLAGDSPLLTAGQGGVAMGAYPTGNEIIGPTIRPKSPAPVSVD